MYTFVYLKKLNGKVTSLNSGMKSFNLLRLKSMGFKIPETFVLPYEVHKF